MFHCALDPNRLIEAYGLWVLFLFVFVECTGVPLPGETALIGAALYAGSTHRFELWQVIAVAFAAAVLGDTMGYFIGRKFGRRLLVAYGRHVGITERKLRAGEHLFCRHGGKIVFFGRFVALLRVLAALLAGAHHMPWRRFGPMNALGGLAWASLFAGAAYWFGDRVSRVERPIAFGLLAAVAIGIAVAALAARRFERKIGERAGLEDS
jgi:membrane protein DedA with SNARE-associated domain